MSSVLPQFNNYGRLSNNFNGSKGIFRDERVIQKQSALTALSTKIFNQENRDFALEVISYILSGDSSYISSKWTSNDRKRIQTLQEQRFGLSSHNTMSLSKLPSSLRFLLFLATLSIFLNERNNIDMSNLSDENKNEFKFFLGEFVGTNCNIDGINTLPLRLNASFLDKLRVRNEGDQLVISLQEYTVNILGGNNRVHQDNNSEYKSDDSATNSLPNQMPSTLLNKEVNSKKLFGPNKPLPQKKPSKSKAFQDIYVFMLKMTEAQRFELFKQLVQAGNSSDTLLSPEIRVALGVLAKYEYVDKLLGKNNKFTNSTSQALFLFYIISVGIKNSFYGKFNEHGFKQWFRIMSAKTKVNGSFDEVDYTHLPVIKDNNGTVSNTVGFKISGEGIDLDIVVTPYAECLTDALSNLQLRLNYSGIPLNSQMGFFLSMTLEQLKAFVNKGELTDTNPLNMKGLTEKESKSINKDWDELKRIYPATSSENKSEITTNQPESEPVAPENLENKVNEETKPSYESLQDEVDELPNSEVNSGGLPVFPEVPTHTLSQAVDLTESFPEGKTQGNSVNQESTVEETKGNEVIEVVESQSFATKREAMDLVVEFLNQGGSQANASKIIDEILLNYSDARLDISFAIQVIVNDKEGSQSVSMLGIHNSLSDNAVKLLILACIRI